jgi:hypothetical protein
MVAPSLNPDEPTTRRWPRRLAVVLVLLFAGLVALWLARRPIASDLIRRELAARGVPASYTVEEIGFRTQRLENVRIGDPRAPDLVARWVEIDLVPTLGAPRLREIRADGVRLRAALVGGRLRLGAVERLLPAGAGGAFALTDLRARLTDAQVALATPAGPVRLALDGGGNLNSGFAGRLVALAPMLAVAGCRLSAAELRLAVATRGGRPRFDGPVRAEAIACVGAGAAALSGRLDVTLSPALDGWRGFLQLAGRAARASGWQARQLRVQADFAGDARETAGTARVAGIDVTGAPARAGRVELAGRYGFGPHAADRMPGEPRRAPEPGWRFEGLASASGVRPSGGIPRPGTAPGTPVAPLLAALDRVLDGAARTGLAFRTRLVAAQLGAAGSLRLEDSELTGGGAVATLTGGEGVRLVWPGNGAWQVDGRLAVVAPGLPRITGTLRQAAPGARLAALLDVAPWRDSGTSIVLAPVRIDGGSFSSRALVSGAIAGGRVEGLSLPLAGRLGAAGLVLNPGCTSVGFARIELAGLRLDPATLRLCATGAGLVANDRVAGRLVAPRLSGRLGASPVRIGADALAFAGGNLVATGLAVRLGNAERTSRLDVARIERRAGEGLAGRFSGAGGEIANVPLRISDGQGRWRLQDGRLALAGAVRVADTANPPRFNPLVASDFALTLAGRDVRAGGTLAERRSGAAVTRVAIHHDLTAGQGMATLDVPGLRFGRSLQPEAITRLTLGVVADVDGELAGQGRIAWSPDGVTSSGRFRVQASSLAAAFGPVGGLAGEIAFTDLLGLVTAPDQVMTVASINPGVLVESGVVRYQLIPGLRVQVLRGDWPFAGGRLALRPTILDFSADAARRLTFDVDGLDAARFISKLEVKNLDATGIFDGTLPMVFDAGGGRITGGSLASRDPGGRLAYVGEVSNANLGIWGNIAFDALKSITYRNMTIDLDGDIDGEMVSRIRFEGVSRGTIQPVATGLIARIGGRLATQLQALPFRFNVQIRAPFRGLISTARSFYDPGFLVRDRLPAGFEPADGDPGPVQPPASRNER